MTNRNVFPARTRQTKTIDTSSLIRITPGRNGVPLPVTNPVKEMSIPAGLPEVVLAKDRVSKDQNPQNFSAFGKLQGLKYNVISCMLQDKSGNL